MKPRSDSALVRLCAFVDESTGFYGDHAPGGSGQGLSFSKSDT